jgi:hypothetical protein
VLTGANCRGIGDAVHVQQGKAESPDVTVVQWLLGWLDVGKGARRLFDPDWSCLRDGLLRENRHRIRRHGQCVAAQGGVRGDEDLVVRVWRSGRPRRRKMADQVAILVLQPAAAPAQLVAAELAERVDCAGPAARVVALTAAGHEDHELSR